MRLSAAALCVIALTSTANAQGGLRGSPVAFPTTPTHRAALRDSGAVAPIIAPAALSPRGRSVVLFAVLGAVLVTLAVADECGESGCMTVLPFVYGAVVGAGAGALVGWIVTAF